MEGLNDAEAAEMRVLLGGGPGSRREAAALLDSSIEAMQAALQVRGGLCAR